MGELLFKYMQKVCLARIFLKIVFNCKLEVI